MVQTHKQTGHSIDFLLIISISLSLSQFAARNDTTYVCVETII